MLPVVIQIVAGMFGGNVVGQASPRLTLGTAWNTALGALGGLGLGQLGQLAMRGAGEVASGAGHGTVAGLDVTAFLAHLGTGGVGGGILVALAGVILRRRT